MMRPEAQDIDITPDQNGATTQPVQRNPTEEDVDITPHEIEEPSFGAKALDVGGRALDYAGGIARTGLANSPAGSMADMLQAYLRKKPLVSQPGDIGRALVGKAPRSDEYMERAGIPEGGSLSDLVPGAFTEEPGFTWKAKKGGLLDPTARGVGATALDMLTDPLMYTGVGELAKGKTVYDKLANTLRRAASPLQTSKEALREGALAATEAHLRPTPGIKLNKGPDKLADIAAETLDSGAMKPLSKAASTAENLGKLKDQSGAVMGDMVNESTAQIRPQDIADRFDAQVIEPLRGTEANKDLVAHLEAKKKSFLDNYTGTEGIYESMPDDLKKIFDSMPEQSKPAVLEALAKEKTVTPAIVEREKQGVNQNIEYDSNRKPTAKGLAQKGWANVLKTSSENAIDNPAFQDAKRAFGNFASAKKMADRTGALLGGGVGLLGHLTDLAVAGEAGRELYNGDPKGLALIAGRALTRGRMASTAGVGLNSLSKLAGSKYAPVIDAYLRRKEIDSASPAPRGNAWSNALQLQNGGNQ